MIIESLKANIDTEINMIRELDKIYSLEAQFDAEETRIYFKIAESLARRVSILNDSIPDILDKIGTDSISNKREEEPKGLEIVQIKPLNTTKKEVAVIVSERNRTEFLKELNIDSQLIKKIKKRQKEKPKKLEKFNTTNWYGKFANKVFFNFSQKLVSEGSFKSLILDIRKSNLNILSTTYLSMMFMTIVLASILGVFVMIFFLFFSFDFLNLSIEVYSGSYLLRFVKILWVLLAVPGLAFLVLYSYPAAEKKSTAGKINQEIPFVVIHMASISGSGIEPVELFRIIATSKEYEFAGNEFTKILNQTNLYGYDLSTALRNVSLSTPSSKFSELLNGMAVTINSGGDMKKFFEKRAESLLLEYRLEREKANKSAETFMDLYISIVIATPMIMVMLLVIISISKISTGFNPTQMTTAIIGLVAIVNVIFIAFLHMKQPNY
ncbi:MAG: type II secretion system F family protein [Nanoarchaeota archaeon]